MRRSKEGTTSEAVASAARFLSRTAGAPSAVFSGLRTSLASRLGYEAFARRNRPFMAALVTTPRQGHRFAAIRCFKRDAAIGAALRTRLRDAEPKPMITHNYNRTEMISFGGGRANATKV